MPRSMESAVAASGSTSPPTARAIARRCSGLVGSLVATRSAFVRGSRPTATMPNRSHTCTGMAWSRSSPNDIVSGATREMPSWCAQARISRSSVMNPRSTSTRPMSPPMVRCSSFAFSSCSWVIAPCRSKSSSRETRAGGRGVTILPPQVGSTLRTIAPLRSRRAGASTDKPVRECDVEVKARTGGTTMKTQRLFVLLTVVNLGLLTFLLVRVRSAEARGAVSVLRGGALEIVDDQGRVRASIQVLPATVQSGKRYPETVLLRLVDPNGRPSVKLGASVEGAGLGLGGESDPTYAVLKAEGADTSLKLTNKDGRQQLIEP